MTVLLYLLLYMFFSSRTHCAVSVFLVFLLQNADWSVQFAGRSIH